MLLPPLSVPPPALREGVPFPPPAVREGVPLPPLGRKGVQLPPPPPPRPPLQAAGASVNSRTVRLWRAAARKARERV